MIDEKIERKKVDSWLISCPACFAVNNNQAEFCSQCNYRFAKNLDPMGIVYSEGEMLGKSLTQRPKFIVMLGTWFLFLPMFAVGVFLSVSEALYDRGINGFFFFWLGVIFCGVSFKFIFTVTKNYHTMGKKSFEDDGEII